MTVRLEGWAPRLTITPGTPAELAEALHDAQRAGETVLIAGLGARLDQGNPVNADRLVRMTGLSRLIDYQPDDMTVTVEAGMPLSELQAVLANRGQRLALDPPLPERTTLGGLVAANPDGPWRTAYGTVRDQVLGLTVATADGQCFRSGSRVVKSVAGYDLPKLFTGSFGTLGAIAEVSLRVRPLPPASGAIQATWPDVSRLDEAWKALRGAPLQPTFFEVSTSATEATLAMGFEGQSEAVDWQLREFERHVQAPCERFDDALRARLGERAAHADAPLLLKASVPPAEAMGFLREAAATGSAPEAWTGRAGNGVLYGGFAGAGDWDVPSGRALVEALRRLATERQGSLVAQRAPLAWKEGWDVWGPTRPDFPLMKAIKRAFDPQGTLAPGRFVGGL